MRFIILVQIMAVALFLTGGAVLANCPGVTYTTGDYSTALEYDLSAHTDCNLEPLPRNMSVNVTTVFGPYLEWNDTQCACYDRYTGVGVTCSGYVAFGRRLTWDHIKLLAVATATTKVSMGSNECYMGWTVTGVGWCGEPRVEICLS